LTDDIPVPKLLRWLNMQENAGSQEPAMDMATVATSLRTTAQVPA
jgi:hypothetical protein